MFKLASLKQLWVESFYKVKVRITRYRTYIYSQQIVCVHKFLNLDDYSSQIL